MFFFSLYQVLSYLTGKVKKHSVHQICISSVTTVCHTKKFSMVIAIHPKFVCNLVINPSLTWEHKIMYCCNAILLKRGAIFDGRSRNLWPVLLSRLAEEETCWEPIEDQDHKFKKKLNYMKIRRKNCNRKCKTVS